jgi:hypothetical protein
MKPTLSAIFAEAHTDSAWYINPGDADPTSRSKGKTAEKAAQ